MPPRVSTRVVVNRQALSAIQEGFVAGMVKVGEATLAEALPNVPDAPPLGQGLVVEGAFGVWADGKKVAGTAAKPRGEETKNGIHLYVGYPFPMRFYEEGTIHQPARPVLTPVMMDIGPRSADYIAPEVRQRLGRG